MAGHPSPVAEGSSGRVRVTRGGEGAQRRAELVVSSDLSAEVCEQAQPHRGVARLLDSCAARRWLGWRHRGTRFG